MKRIEDIEKMELSELETLAELSDAKLKEESAIEIENALACAMALEEEKRSRRQKKAAFCSLAAALACACVAVAVLLRPQPLEDSFTDPAQAREYVLQAFDKIGTSMDKGMRQAGKASKQLEKPAEIIQKIYR